MVGPFLIIVTSDPRTSPRPAEAIRIAAGVGAWKRAEVLLYLREAAILALSEFVDELVDEDHFHRYLPIVGEWERPVYVQRGHPLRTQLGTSPVRFEEIGDDELATLAAQAGCIAWF
jgi:hypothetical protein